MSAEWSAVPETGAPGGLVLDSASYPLRIPDLSPGAPAYWQIHTRVDRDESVALDLELRKDGTLVTHPDGLRVAVTACDHEWQHMATTPTCDSATPILEAGPTDRLAGLSKPVPHPDHDGEAFLLVELSVADTTAAAADQSLMGLTATIGIGVTATADTPTAAPAASASPDAAASSRSRSAGHPPTASTTKQVDSLAYTGGAFLAPVLLAGALVLSGVAIRLRRRARS
ncbi:hypothetical protein DEJ23_14790 [Curtobacterium sp. MCSS17_008]|nr:hypothetical protein DEJ23_14790 [Curtobacterium sp. MCSS17_008]